jgi:hypothetical protein
MFPGVFVDAGDYWVELEVPAQGGERIARRVELADASMAYGCSRAAAIMRARVAPSPGAAGKIALVDPIYLRLRGERWPQSVGWPAQTPQPSGRERAIVCGNGGTISWVERDTPDARRKLKDLVAADPPEAWPRDEDRDPRFAPPSGQNLPGSEQQRIGLDRRLSAE